MKENVEENGCILNEPVFTVERNQNEEVSVTKYNHENLNPFVHKLPLDSVYDHFKLLFMSIFVLPIRIFFIIICLLVAYFLTLVGTYGLSKEDLATKPIKGWRRVAKDQVCLWVRFLYVGFGFHFVPVKGRRAGSKEAPILVVAPHSSMFDALPVVVMGAPSIVAKGESQAVPFFARYIDFTQPVYVWREDTNSRQNTIAEITRRANSEDEWPQVMIFPEGTCTNRSCLITYKPGAFFPGVPVQPVVIRYPNKTDCMTWTWDGPGAAKMLWVTLCQFHNYCELEYLPVYHPSPEEKEDPRLFAANVRQLMADSVGVPIVDYTYDDCRIMHKAHLKNLPCNTGLIEFQKIRHKYGNVTLKEVEEELLNQFAEMAQSEGKISLSDFAHYFGVPTTEPALVQLFNLCDKDGCGLIGFRDFVVYRCEMTKEPLLDETVSKAFKLFDQKGKEGNVTAEAFAETLLSSLQIDSETASGLFAEADSDSKGYLTHGDFKTLVQRKPEYGKLFLLYQKSVQEGTRSKLVKPATNGVLAKKKLE